MLIIMVLITKDVFEPSYNDLKFMIQKPQKKKTTQLHLHQPITTSYTEVVNPSKSSMHFDLFP